MPDETKSSARESKLREIRKMPFSQCFANAAGFALPFIIIGLTVISALRGNQWPRGAKSVVESFYGDVRFTLLQLVVLFVTAFWLDKKHASKLVRSAASSVLWGYIWLGILIIILPIFGVMLQFIGDFR